MRPRQTDDRGAADRLEYEARLAREEPAERHDLSASRRPAGRHSGDSATTAGVSNVSHAIRRRRLAPE